MNTQFGMGAVLLAVTGAAFLMVKPGAPDVYDMPVQAAYDKLVHVDFGAPGDAERALKAEKSASGNGHDRVSWKQEGDAAAMGCVLQLAPLPDNANKTKVSVQCAAGSAAPRTSGGSLHDQFRAETIERIDATLRGRPFSAELAKGATAARWPAENAVDPIGAAVGGASARPAAVQAGNARPSQDAQAVDHEPGTADAEPATAAN